MFCNVFECISSTTEFASVSQKAFTFVRFVYDCSLSEDVKQSSKSKQLQREGFF